VTGVAARRFMAPAPSSDRFPAAVREAVRSDAVEGWLVGVRDGSTWGWWGPVEHSIAADMARVLGEVADRSPASPDQWAERARAVVRHGHTGVLAVASGAFELACWDLIAKREDVPVWALVADAASRQPVRTYATCFGAAPRAEVAHAAALWPVQKWSARQVLASVPGELAAAAGGDGTIAVDFHGGGTPAVVDEVRRRVGAVLAWIEEPLPPRYLHTAVDRHFGAPHAAGEHCYGVFEAGLLERAGVDLWQPDAVFCGGWAELRAILAVASAARRRSAPHGGGFLPAAHAAAAGSEVWAVEHHLLLEPRRQAHLADGLLPDFANGSTTLPVPTRPGWSGPLHPAVLGGHDE